MEKLESKIKEKTAPILMEHEYLEALRLLDQAYAPFSKIGFIKQVYDKMSNKGVNPVFGAMAIYEIGRINGIRAERKRRKREPEVNRSIAV